MFRPQVDTIQQFLFNTLPILEGQIAQLVEQRIENPRVGGSIPSLATTFEHPKSRAKIPKLR